MIYDDIKNLADYKVVSDNVLKFIDELTLEIENGRHIIDENSYANVNIYETKPLDKCALEAHQKYIDIQLLLSGKERLDYISTEGLAVKDEYDANKDIIFYDTPSKPLNSVYLAPLNFTLLYPHEAHMPQIAVNNQSESVKKVVIKIKITDKN